MMLYISVKFLENILNGFHTKLPLSSFKGRITPKLYRQELRFLCSAHCLMTLYISMKFHKNTLKDFKL